MTFLEHLDAFRKHLVRSVIAILVLSIVAFVFKDILFNEIIFAPRDKTFFTNRVFCRLADILSIQPLCINQKPISLLNVDLAGQFSVHIMVSIVAGIIMAFPYLIFELWRFAKPALKPKERRYSNGMVFYVSLLFTLGVVFGYFLIVPLTLEFLGTYQISEQVVNQINIKSYISSVTTVCLATGLVFELPILVYFLSKIGMLTPEFLRKYRRHSIVVIFILSGVITPPDILSQVLVAFPILFLYEISIKISKRVNRKKQGVK